jgi:hypothetical protein
MPKSSPFDNHPDPANATAGSIFVSGKRAILSDRTDSLDPKAKHSLNSSRNQDPPPRPILSISRNHAGMHSHDKVLRASYTQKSEEKPRNPTQKTVQAPLREYPATKP